MSDKSIHIAELQLLKHLIDNPKSMELCEENFFITEIALDIFDSLRILMDHHVSFTDAHILSELVKKDSHVQPKVLDKIHDIEVEDDKASFEYYYYRMKEEYYSSHLSEKALPEAIISLAKKGKTDITKVDELIDSLENLKDVSRGRSRLRSLSGKEAIAEYENYIKDQLENPDKEKTGDWYLDESGIEFKEGEITTLFSNAGSGKTTTVQKILEGRMIKTMPFSWYITEMSTPATMNRVASSTSKTLTKACFKPKNVEGEMLVDDAAMNHLKHMKRKYGAKDSWRIVPCDETPLTLDLLEESIPEQRRLLKVPKGDTFLICIDLASMIPELSGDPSQIEDGMNKLSFLAKKYKVHFLLVVQSKEKRGQNITIKKLDDVFKYRPVLEDIKNSSAFTERSRTILMSFRPMNIINKFEALREDPLVDLVEDILYLTVLKTNHGKEGATLHYLFDGARSKLTAYPTFGGWASQFQGLDEDSEESEDEDKKSA